MNVSDSEAHNVNWEALLGVRWNGCSGIEAGAAAGPGFTTGIGTPDYRVVAMLGYAPRNCNKAQEKIPEPPADRDGDGVFDAQDACPDVAGVPTSDPATNGCPSDRDHDGILDAADACPDVAGVKTDDPSTNGCPPPPDRDNDGIVDAQDACPDLAGIPSTEPSKHGCPLPPDRDHDSIIDELDACPDVPGLADPNPKHNGCPRVQVVGKTIVILDQVQFETGKSVIKPESEVILENILAAINSVPADKHFLLEGHTDSRGNATTNRRLSQKRADAVVTWLVAHGVQKTRLKAKGHGPDKPVATNATDEGRTQNRRVEIHIVD